MLLFEYVYTKVLKDRKGVEHFTWNLSSGKVAKIEGYMLLLAWCNVEIYI